MLNTKIRNMYLLLKLLINNKSMCIRKSTELRPVTGRDVEFVIITNLYHSMLK